MPRTQGGAGAAAVLLTAFLAVCMPASGSWAEPRVPQVLWVQRVQGKPLSFPVDVALDRRGVVFLLDSGNRSIGLFSPKGEFMREIQGKGSWKDPLAIAVGPDGMIYIADGEAGRVLELDLSGKTRREYAAGGNARITGVGVFGNGIYCVDNRNDRVVVFRKGGGAPESWGKKGERPGEFQSPFRLAIDGAGRIFVTDVMNARVQWFSAFGRYLGSMKRFGAGEGKMFRPTAISLDNRGRIWVGDSYTGLVQLFEENGTRADVLSTEGRPHVFGDPLGVAAGPEGVWVADQRESRAALFRR